MKAVVWHGRRDVRVDNVPDPKIQESTDALIRVTSTGLCGSDLHLVNVLAPFMTEGDIVGHEPMGVVEAVGADVQNLQPGDRVVVPFNISCGGCFMCQHGLQSQCETTQVRAHEKGAALFGYTKLYGQVPGGQAEYLRVPQANYGPIKVPDGPPDDRFLFLSDVLPTAWQAVEYAEIPPGGTVVVLGLGPIGAMACRVAQHRGAGQVIGVDLVADRLTRAAAHGVDVIDLNAFDGNDAVAEAVRARTGGRGADSVIDAVGMEAHGSPAATVAHKLTALVPSTVSQWVMERVGTDRLAALLLAIELVRRGGTISLSGVYGGMTDPIPMMTLFDKQIRLHMGQANVRRWTDDILSILRRDEDVLGVESFATHHLPLTEAANAYDMFQARTDGALKVVFQP
jgi:threonine dehydrogenase-like Zn-dependent dehydrogenase